MSDKEMSDKGASACTVLHLRFKVRVPPSVFLAKSREAATMIASLEGLIWKIWVLQEEESQLGGIYLFADRRAAEDYLSHPIIQAMRSKPAVESSESQLWDVDKSLSALTRAPLPDIDALKDAR
jgi:hypothetical protein